MDKDFPEPRQSSNRRFGCRAISGGTSRNTSCGHPLQRQLRRRSSPQVVRCFICRPIRLTATLLREAESPCCRNTASSEGRRDGIRLGYAARPYFGNDRCECSSPRICLRRAYPPGSLAGLWRGHCFASSHGTTLTIKPTANGKPQPNGRERLGSRYRWPFHRESVMEAPGISIPRKMTLLSGTEKGAFWFSR